MGQIYLFSKQERAVLDLSKLHMRSCVIQKPGFEYLGVGVAKIGENCLEEDESTTQVIIEELGFYPVKLEYIRLRKMKDT